MEGVIYAKRPVVGIEYATRDDDTGKPVSAPDDGASLFVRAWPEIEGELTTFARKQFLPGWTVEDYTT